MRLDLFAVEGECKWTAFSDGEMLPERLSERGVLRIVKAILRSPPSIGRSSNFAILPKAASGVPQAPFRGANIRAHGGSGFRGASRIGGGRARAWRTTE